MATVNIEGEYKQLLYYATTNKGKVERMDKTLKDYGLPIKIEPLEIQYPPEIASHSIEEIAKNKVIYAYEHLHLMRKPTSPVIAMDAALHIRALDDWPGYDLKAELKMRDENFVLDKLRDKKDRTAHFIESLVYVDKECFETGFYETFNSPINGWIVEDGRGDSKDWLSRLFRPTLPQSYKKELEKLDENYARKVKRTFSKTLGEMDDEDRMILRKVRKSYHIQFAEWFKDILEDTEKKEKRGLFGFLFG
jgi:non-canonical purine NTP pyrophosphatase (RdgB/HAM1 family)